MRGAPRALAAALLVLGTLWLAAPAHAESGTLAMKDGVRIAYQRTGSGPTTLLLIHGWACDHHVWDAALGQLEPHFSVVGVDLAGHGASSAGREVWTVGRLAQDVAELARALDLRRVVFVGHSLGGPVALEAAARVPERALGVVSVESLRELHGPTLWQRVRLSLYEAYLSLAYEDAVTSYGRGLFSPGFDAGRRDAFVQTMVRTKAEVAIPALHERVYWRAGALVEAAAFPVVRVDSEPPASSADGLPRAPLEQIHSDIPGHFPMLEDPPKFSRYLEAAIRRVEALGAATSRLESGAARSAP